MVLVGGRSPALGVFGVGVVGGTTAASVVVEARLRAPSLRRVDRPRGAARRSRLGLTAERRVRAIYTRVLYFPHLRTCTSTSLSLSRPLPRVRAEA